MSKEYNLYLKYILESINKIDGYTRQYIDQEDFFGDVVYFEAVLFNLENIGEAIKHIPDEIKQSYPDIQWRQIAGMRDKIVHHYHGIVKEIVWDIIKNKLPTLKSQVEKIIEDIT